MGESPLTAEAKEAVRAYMFRLVVLPGGFLTALIVLLLGVLWNDIVKQNAENKAFQTAQDAIISLTTEASKAADDAEASKKRLETLIQEASEATTEAEQYRERLANFAQDASRSAADAQRSKEHLETLVTSVEDVEKNAELLRERLETAEAVTVADNLVEQVSTNLIERGDFLTTLAEEFGDRVEALEISINGLRQGEGACSWVPVGYDKSHYHDASAWCPAGSFIKQIDIDGCRRPGDCPVIGRVQCCKVLP